MKFKYAEHFSLSKQWTWTPSTEGTAASRPGPLENALVQRFDQAVSLKGHKDVDVACRPSQDNEPPRSGR